MSTVTIQNVTKSFGRTQVIRAFDEVFRDGEFVTLLGPSGCGKTTLLRMIAGFERPTSGEIRIDNTLVSGEKAFVPPEHREIGMVFQSYAVWPHMNVFSNVAYPLKIKHVQKNEIEDRVARILETVHLSRYADRLPNQLSGGQQQRIALARALVAAPKILLLDEPLSNLDAKLRETMRFDIKELTRSLGITVVYVTHDQAEAMAMSDRVFLLNNGEVQQSGTPEEIYNHPVNPFVADFLGKVDFFTGEAKDGIIRLEDLDIRIPDPGSRSGKVLVAVRPENIMIRPKGEGFPAKLSRMYYLGDITDCRVRVGRSELRVTGDSLMRSRYKEGDEISLEIKYYVVFDGTGGLDQLKILT